MKNEILHGSALEKLKELESESVDCIITSPPYWALRDYKVDGQIGVEKTIDAYITNLIKIFDECKRVLKKEGTCWVVLGDTYAGTGHKGDYKDPKYENGRNGQEIALNNKIEGIPQKSLCMVPERFAIAMTSRRGSLIKKESDRAWLAGIIEGEGCIHIHKREKGRKNATYGIFLSIHNTNKKMIDKVVELTGLGGNLQISNIKTNQTLYRWNAMSENAKSVLRDVYPYMVTKREQVRCALYCPSSGKEAEECFLNLKCLHHYEPQTRDYPEPEVGGVNPWILRNKIIWKKNNCMPSSAKDRFTIDYEYIYFFTKSKKYYFKTQYEPLTENNVGWTKSGRGKWNDGDLFAQKQFRDKEIIFSPEGRIKRCVWTINTKPFSEAHFAVFPEELVKQCLDAGCPSEICVKCGKVKEMIFKSDNPSKIFADNDGLVSANHIQKTSNPQSSKSLHRQKNGVYSTAKFMGYSSCNCNTGFESGIVLDPFMGSGTTALVALKNNRNFLGIELNQAYIDIALKRIEPYLYQTKLVLRRNES